MPLVRSSLLACLAVAVLLVGASACSGDDQSDIAGSAEPQGAEGPSDGEAPADADEEGTSTPEQIAAGVRAGSTADEVKYDGTTMELTYAEGSRGEPDLMGCSLAVGLMGNPDNNAVLVYPDGTYRCYDEDEG